MAPHPKKNGKDHSKPKVSGKKGGFTKSVSKSSFGDKKEDNRSKKPFKGKSGKFSTTKSDAAASGSKSKFASKHSGGFKGKGKGVSPDNEKESFSKKRKFDADEKPNASSSSSSSSAAPKKKSFPKPSSKPSTKPIAGSLQSMLKGKKVVSSDAPKKKVKAPVEGNEVKKYRPNPDRPKPNAALVEHLKLDWNRVRVKSISQQDREALVSKMMSSIQGHVLQVTLRHDVSRIVQSILQFGSTTQRAVILTELLPKFIEISKTPYGHFAIIKAVTHCTTPAAQKQIASVLTGHFVALATNVIGARVVETVLQLYPASLTRPLKAEFYGKNFRILLPEPASSLQHMMQQLPTKHSSILDHMRDLVLKFVNKGLLQFAFVHALLWEYGQAITELTPTQASPSTSGSCPAETPSASISLVTAASSSMEAQSLAKAKASRMDDLVALLAESGPLLLATKAGAKLVCVLTSHAAVKDRKRMIKTLKGKVMESLLHHSAFLGVLRLVDVTDDTVTVQKQLLVELKSIAPDVKYTASGEVVGVPVPPLVAVATHPQACKLLLRLLNPTKRHLEPDEELLFAVEQPATSKKLPSLRRKEHLLFLKAPLISICSRYVEQMLRSRSGSKVLTEVVELWRPSQVVDAIARALVGEAPVEVDAELLEAALEEEGDGDFDAYDGEEGLEEMDDELNDAIGEDDEFGEDEDAVDGEIDLAASIDNDEDAIDEDVSPIVAKADIELLPLEEDQIAASTLRRLLEWDRMATSAGEESIKIDKSNWEVEGDNLSGSLSSVLLQWLISKSKNVEEGDENLLVRWTRSNRACFALAQLLEAPICAEQAKSVLCTSEIRSALAQSAAVELPGGKKLAALIEDIEGKSQSGKASRRKSSGAIAAAADEGKGKKKSKGK